MAVNPRNLAKALKKVGAKGSVRSIKKKVVKSQAKKAANKAKAAKKTAARKKNKAMFDEVRRREKASAFKRDLKKIGPAKYRP